MDKEDRLGSQNMSDPPKLPDFNQNVSAKPSRKLSGLILGIGATAIVLIAVAVIFFMNNPQRTIAKEAQALLSQAEMQVANGAYEDALNTLMQIDTQWDDYANVNGVRQKAVRGQLIEKLSGYAAAGNYEAVISTINSEMSDLSADAEIKTIYNNAIQNYKAAAIASAAEYAEAGDYTSAKSVLTVAENFIGTDSEISAKRKEIEQQEIMAVVLSYEADGNYEDAILHLNKNSAVVSGSVELQNKLSTCTEKYRAAVISEADSVYKTEGYQSAVSLLNDALKVLPNDANITSEKAKYEALEPVALVDLNAFYSDYGSDTKLVGVTLKDKLGNTYYNCIEYFGGHSIFAGGNVSTFKKRDTYILNGQYRTFKATVFVPETRSSFWDTEIHDTDISKGSFSLRIYGDEKLLYQSPLMISTQLPVNIDVDVSGVEQLSFAWATFADVSSEIGLSEAYLYKD